MGSNPHFLFITEYLLNKNYYGKNILGPNTRNKNR
jgi:hypothetical protein